jgi:hypothetical protein
MIRVAWGAIHVQSVELGFEPEHSAETRVRRDERDRERDHIIDQVFAEFRAGARDNPFAILQQRAYQSPNPLTECLWIHDRVARSQLQADEHFRPLARALLSDFDRHFPDDPMAKRAQRRAARLAR